MYLSKVCKNTTKGEPRSVVSLLVLGACFLSVSVRTIDSEPTAATAAVPETVSAPATVGSLFVVFFFAFDFSAQPVSIRDPLTSLKESSPFSCGLAASLVLFVPCRCTFQDDGKDVRHSQ